MIRGHGSTLGLCICCSFSHVWVLALSSLLHVRKLRPREAEELALTRQVDQYQILRPEKGGLDFRAGRGRGEPSYPATQPQALKGTAGLFPAWHVTCVSVSSPRTCTCLSGPATLTWEPPGITPPITLLCPTPCHPHPNQQPPGLKCLPRLWAPGSPAGQET